MMKTCRLKIITANIIDDTDTPKIQYISQNKKSNVKYKELIDELSNIEEKKEELIEQKEDKENLNNPNNNEINNIEQFTKNDIDNNNIDNNNIDNNNIDNNNNDNNMIEDRKDDNNMGGNNIEDNIGGNNIEYNIEGNNIADNIVEENKIDINNLCTKSNQYEYEDDTSNIVNNNNNNYDILKSHQSNNIINNYPYNIEHKKKELKSSLRYLFKNRDTKGYKGYSSVYDNNKNKSKKVKNIIVSDTLKYPKQNISKVSKVNMNKSSHGLNININKLFCINNSKNQKRNKSNSQSIKNLSFQIKTNTKSKSKSKSLNKNKFIKKNKTSKNKLNYILNDSQISSVSWNVVEKSDFIIDQTIDYTFLLDDLINKECELIREKEKIIEDYEARLKPIRELNSKLLSENEVEIDREDELKGELIVLKNHYERIFSQLNLKEKKNVEAYFNLENYIENNKAQEEFNNKIKEIDNEVKILNDYLKNGEIMVVTKPQNLENLTFEENKNVTLMLKGLFVSIHALNTDKIVDLIWKKNRQIQTIYFLVGELQNIFKLEPNLEKNILINYFYSFCKKYDYMNINQFKFEFKEKIGKIQLYNKYIYISKLINFHGSSLHELMKTMKDKDIYDIGVIKYEQLKSMLFDAGLYLYSRQDQNSQEFLEFMVFCMKKDRSLELNKYTKQPKKVDKDNSEIKYSLYDLYYQSFLDFYDEFNCNIVANPYKRIRLYMKKNDINNAELILRPLFIEKNILKIDKNEYIDEIILNKYLRRIEIILNDERISAFLFEEELVDKNKFINDVYDYDDSKKNEIENNQEQFKKKVDNFIDDIFGLF